MKLQQWLDAMDKLNWGESDYGTILESRYTND